MTEFLTVDTSLPPYLVFPRFLLDMDLNETTKLLYMILLDRARLSLRNEGWTDASGHVFLYFTIEAMANVLHKSQMTIKTSLAALENKGLILRKRQGAGHPNRIYVKFPEDAFRETDRILSPRQTENGPYNRQDSFPETDRKLSGNKKEIKKNDLSKRESQEDRSPYGNFQNVFLSAKELENVSLWKLSECIPVSKRTGERQADRPQLAGLYRAFIRLHSFHRKAVPEPCSHHHQLGATGQSPFPAKIL